MSTAKHLEGASEEELDLLLSEAWKKTIEEKAKTVPARLRANTLAPRVPVRCPSKRSH
jgi:hypothetical protein